MMLMQKCGACGVQTFTEPHATIRFNKCCCIINPSRRCKLAQTNTLACQPFFGQKLVDGGIGKLIGFTRTVSPKFRFFKRIFYVDLDDHCPMQHPLTWHMFD